MAWRCGRAARQSASIQGESTAQRRWCLFASRSRAEPRITALSWYTGSVHTQTEHMTAAAPAALPPTAVNANMQPAQAAQGARRRARLKALAASAAAAPRPRGHPGRWAAAPASGAAPSCLRARSRAPTTARHQPDGGGGAGAGACRSRMHIPGRGVGVVLQGRMQVPHALLAWRAHAAACPRAHTCTAHDAPPTAPERPRPTSSAAVVLRASTSGDALRRPALSTCHTRRRQLPKKVSLQCGASPAVAVGALQRRAWEPHTCAHALERSQHAPCMQAGC